MNLDRTLRDAAEPVPLRAGAAPAQALLDRIVRSPADETPAPAGAGRAVWRPRKAVVGVFAVAAAVAALTLQNLGFTPAYASWTPDPSPLTVADQSDFIDRCAAEVSETWQEGAPADFVLGERRGDYAYMSVVTPSWSSTCFRDSDGTVRSPSIFVDPVSAEKLGRKGVELQGWGQLRTAEGYCRLMAGHVGSQVVGVDITVRAGSGDSRRTVRATLKDGYFLAWYPEGLDEASSNRTSLTLRLADGTAVENLSARDLYETPVLTGR